MVTPKFHNISPPAIWLLVYLLNTFFCSYHLIHTKYCSNNSGRLATYFVCMRCYETKKKRSVTHVWAARRRAKLATLARGPVLLFLFSSRFYLFSLASIFFLSLLSFPSCFYLLPLSLLSSSSRFYLFSLVGVPVAPLSSLCWVCFLCLRFSNTLLSSPSTERMEFTCRCQVGL